MNKTLNFGYSQLGKFYLIKLNCKISIEDAEKLTEMYPEIWISQTRNGIRIEGCINMVDPLTKFATYERFDGFKNYLAFLMNNYKINKLIDKSQKILKLRNIEPKLETEIIEI